MKATEQYFPVVLFIILYKEVSTFAVLFIMLFIRLSRGVLYYSVKGRFNFQVCG